MPADYCGSCYGAEANPGDCCNTCEQVREAYRTKGWAFVNPDGIEQCVREGFTEKLREQVDEGTDGQYKEWGGEGWKKGGLLR